MSKIEAINQTDIQISILENYINDIPLIMDPCNLCENKKDGNYNTKICIDCCFYYSSCFKYKKIKGE